MTASRPPHRPLLAATLAAAALLAGCATPIARSVVEANLAQEQAANKLLLLNIARAHERMPMHFSQIGQLRAAPGGWGLGVPSLGLSLPFGGAAKSEYTLTAGNEGASPVDVSALTSQEFMRGITTPVSPETLAYFINQGWSKALLMHVFFESVEQSDKEGKPIQRWLNDPGRTGYAAFRTFVERASACDLALEAATATEFLSGTQPSFSAKEIAQVKSAKLDLVRVQPDGQVNAENEAANTHFRIAASTSSAVLKFVPPPGATKDLVGDCEMEPKKLQLSARPARRLAANASSRGSDGTGWQAVLRSPQAALFYLGQLSHAQNHGWYASKDHPHENDEKPLLEIRAGREKTAALFNMTNRGNSVATPALSVDYAGRVFAVPHYDGSDSSAQQDRSMTVLALMQLILGLQDKGTEAPGASSVRLVR